MWKRQALQYKMASIPRIAVTLFTLIATVVLVIINDWTMLPTGIYYGSKEQLDNWTANVNNLPNITDQTVNNTYADGETLAPITPRVVQMKIQEAIDIETWIQRVKKEKKKPNVLFLVADDMRPEIGAYIHEKSPWLEPGMVTPNLDVLASKGLLFRRAYCQFSWCNPSRSSFLTSRRPDTTMVHNNSVFFRQNNPNFISLPQYFKNNGYLTLGMGKIFHQMNFPNDNDDPHSWSKPMYNANVKELLNDGAKTWEAVTDEARDGKLLLDELVAANTKETIRSIAKSTKESNRPFFVAMGMKKPHLNWYFPAHFLDTYSLRNLSMPSNPTASSSLPGIAWFNSFEIRGRHEYLNYTKNWGKTETLPEWMLKDLRRAYYSSITYIDDLIGQVLTELEELGLAENTIVSFIGDHGFHLGEHSIVGKNTAFEVANNAPMIIRVPGVTDGGLVSDKLVEFVDLFPTLAELTGLPTVPYCPGGNKSREVDLCTEGTSLLPLLKDPSTKKWKDRVFYQYPHYLGMAQSFCMGYSMRTEQYRYTEWINYEYEMPVHANWTKLCAAELYDHYKDPHETNNLADDATLKKVRKDLSAKLQAGWLEALPS